MSRFKITGALWDRINHFAAFPQTGGMSIPTAHLHNSALVTENDNSYAWRENRLVRKQSLTSSITSTDGPIRPEPVAGNTAESIPVLVGRTTHKALASYSGIGCSSRWTKQDAEYRKSQRVVCAEFRGESILNRLRGVKKKADRVRNL